MFKHDTYCASETPGRSGATSRRASGNNLRLDRRSALDPQPFERGPNLLLTLLLQDRLVFEPEDEGVKPEQ